MCGRFVLEADPETVLAVFGGGTVEGGSQLHRKSFNISPTDQISIIVMVDGQRVLKPARWGFIPRWWTKPLRELPNTINARSEKLAEGGRSMFSDAYVKRRCIIPASGFYEWTGEKKDRIPHFFSAADGQLLGLAGLWDVWTDPETGQPVVTCTIITRKASPWMEKYHDRMPAILWPADFDLWLRGEGGEDLLQSPPRELKEWIVSQRVNRAGVGKDDPTLVDPVEPEPPPPPPEPPKQGTLF